MGDLRWELFHHIVDEEVVASLRQYYNKNEQYKINFYHWLRTAKKTKDGILLLLVVDNSYTCLGCREVKSGCGTSVC